MQVKARLASADTVLRALESGDITVIRAVHYHQYDTYFFFDDPAQGRLRYREDEILDEQGKVTSARARLTLTGPVARGGVRLGAAVPLALLRARRRTRRASTANISSRRASARSRRIAAAGWSRIRGVQFYVHVDRLLNPPAEGYLPRSEVADLVAARRAGQGRDHHRAARTARRAARTRRSKADTSSSDVKLTPSSRPVAPRPSASSALTDRSARRRATGGEVAGRASRSRPGVPHGRSG